MRFSPIVAHLFLVAVMASASSSMAAPGVMVSAPPAPAHVAIANPSYIFAHMKETLVLRDKLEVRRKELQAKDMAQRKAIDNLSQQRSDVNPSNHQYREITDQIINAKAQLQAWGMATKASVDEDQKNMLKDLYDKIEAAVGEVAQQNGIDLVIADGRQDIKNLDEIPPEEFRHVLNTRNVLYANKTVDLTEKVLLLLDTKFAAGAVAPVPLK